jgi:hypothetical protein
MSSALWKRIGKVLVDAAVVATVVVATSFVEQLFRTAAEDDSDPEGGA